MNDHQLAPITEILPPVQHIPQSRQTSQAIIRGEDGQLDACEVHPSTLDYQVAGGVESLAQMIDSDDGGQAFFEKSYLTRGMEELLREGLLRLSGQTDQALFELAQAMGGGKTHLRGCLKRGDSL